MPSATVATIQAQHDPDYPYAPPRTAAANAAPRCEHIKYNNEQCGCPALRGQDRCRFHVHAEKALNADLPLPEDAAAVQLAVLRIMRALLNKQIDYKTASLLFYGLQIASMNLKRLETLFALPAARFDHQREKSLAEELLMRLDDKEFCAELTRAQREFPVDPDPPKHS